MKKIFIRLNNGQLEASIIKPETIDDALKALEYYARNKHRYSGFPWFQEFNMGYENTLAFSIGAI
jgi:autonomous glycyl radical cofactor GrcA